MSALLLVAVLYDIIHGNYPRLYNFTSWARETEVNSYIYIYDPLFCFCLYIYIYKERRMAQMFKRDISKT